MADAEDATNTRPTRAPTPTQRFADQPEYATHIRSRAEQADDDDSAPPMSESSADAEDPKDLDHVPIAEEDDSEEEDDEEAVEEEDDEDKKVMIELVLMRGDGTIREKKDAGRNYGEVRCEFSSLRLDEGLGSCSVALVVRGREVVSTAPGGLFRKRTPSHGRKPLMIGAIYGLEHVRIKEFGDEIDPKKFGGVKYLTDLAKVMRPLKKGDATQSQVFKKEQELTDKTTGEKKSGFIVQDGPWPGDAKPDPKWLFVIAKEEDSEEEES